jgi:HEAT repeat protein
LSSAAAEILVRRFSLSPLDCGGSLEEMGPVAAPAVATMLASDDADLRRNGLEILKEIGGNEQFAAVRKLLTDSNPQIRIAASNAVKAIEARSK